VSAAETKLAVYGTLAPGRSNHHQLSELNGSWSSGTVNGVLREQGWGAALGHPAIVLDPNGPAVEVQVFESQDLPRHWARLDAFEGAGYRRVATQVNTVAGQTDAFIYELAEPGSSTGSA